MSTARFHVVSPVIAVEGGTWRQATSPVNPTDPYAAWRLLGGNNRELGRSGAVHEGADAVHGAIETLRQDLESAALGIAREGVEGTWTWRLRALDGAVLACSGRGYARERECRYAFAAFQVSALTARLPIGLVLS